jgi:GT2 family glycosyltransferase
VSAELIVLDLDGGEMLRRCLRSIERQTVLPWRLTIVDNGSREPVVSRIGPTTVPRRVIRSERNSGFTGGINLAMREVESELVGWVNNDVELDPRWLEKLIRVLQTDPGAAGVQPIILRPDGLVDGGGIEISSGRFLQRGEGKPEVTGEPWGISATASLFRTAALRSVAAGEAVLHRSFFAYYEDVELSARLAAGGWRVHLLEEPLAVHGGSSSAPALGARAAFLRTRNRYWVRRLHRGVGSYRELLLEDLRLGARELLRLRFLPLASRIAGLGSGFASPGAKVM